MVSTINPVVYGNQRGQWRRCVALHFLGAAFGGALMWATMSVLLHLVEMPVSDRVVASIAVIGLGVAIDARIVRIWIPTTGRQVPSNLRYRASREWVALRYGFELGLGVVTRVTFAVTYSALVTVGLLFGVVFAGLCGASFGIAHAMLVLRGRNVKSHQQLEQRALWVWEHTSAMRAVVVIATVLMLVSLGLSLGNRAILLTMLGGES